MATKKNPPAGEPAGYAEAMAEIESILSELDSPNVDVDVLGAKVTRASELITWCSERIAAAEFTVKQLVESLDIDSDADEDDDFDDEEWDEDDEDEDDEEGDDF